MEGNVKRKYMKHLFSPYWYLSVFVSCVYTFFSVIYKFLPLSVFVSVSFVEFSGCNNVKYVNYNQSSLLCRLLQCLNK